jgi:hypothetical protein
MSTQATMEQRLAAVEQDVCNLRRELSQLLAQRETPAEWLKRVSGSMKDEPAFDEVLKYGRAFREADWPAEDGQP